MGSWMSGKSLRSGTMPRATSSSRNGTNSKVRLAAHACIHTDFALGWPDSSEGLKRLHKKFILYVPPLPTNHH
jgi:hypothetical protein